MDYGNGNEKVTTYDCQCGHGTLEVRYVGERPNEGSGYCTFVPRIEGELRNVVQLCQATVAGYRDRIGLLLDAARDPWSIQVMTDRRKIH